MNVCYTLYDLKVEDGFFLLADLLYFNMERNCMGLRISHHKALQHAILFYILMYAMYGHYHGNP